MRGDELEPAEDAQDQEGGQLHRYQVTHDSGASVVVEVREPTERAALERIEEFLNLTGDSWTFTPRRVS